jgi:hypothetical protein
LSPAIGQKQLPGLGRNRVLPGIPEYIFLEAVFPGHIFASREAGGDTSKPGSLVIVASDVSW